MTKNVCTRLYGMRIIVYSLKSQATNVIPALGGKEDSRGQASRGQAEW